MAVVKNAFVVPPNARESRFLSITDESGVPIRQAFSSAKHSVKFPRYLRKADRDQIPSDPGRYLYCGQYFPHFGHFLLESLSRLWAYDSVKDHIDGLIFFTTMRNPPEQPAYQSILDHLGIKHPILYLTEPRQFAELTVPEQGIGMGPLICGTSTHRRFMKDRLTAIAAPAKDCQKIFISRSAFNLRRGGMLCETVLEQNLMNQGYRIFHPQNESFEDQVATYLGARMIIGADSSAMHLIGFLGKTDQDIAMIIRRKHGAVDLFPQIAAASGREPLLIDAIRRVWVHEGRKPANWGHYADLSFPDIQSELLDAGFISAGHDWVNVGNWKKQKELDGMRAMHGGDIVQSPPDMDPPQLEAFYF